LGTIVFIIRKRERTKGNVAFITLTYEYAYTNKTHTLLESSFHSSSQCLNKALTGNQRTVPELNAYMS